MKYLLIYPPFEFKEFEDMNKKEAQKHFDWFIEEIPRRLEILQGFYSETTGKGIEELDFSPQSLIKLWDWFIPKVEIVQLTKNELEERLKSVPRWLEETILTEPWKLHVLTRSIALDIAIYFAVCFLKKFNNLEWGIVTKPKSHISLNRPVLTGFPNNNDLDPRLIIENLTLRVASGEKDIHLMCKVYKVWAKYLE